MLNAIGRAVEGAAKARRQTKAPLYIRREQGPDPNQLIENISALDFFNNLTEEQQLRLNLKLSWIYSDIDLIARETASTEHHVLSSDEIGKKTRLDTSKLFRLVEEPNPYMSKPFLLRMIVYWLSISRRGAFVYMAPDKADKTKINELWPIQSTRITPQKNNDGYLSHYEYITGGTQSRPKRKFRIPANYVIWLRYPDPLDLWGSLPPLLAALDAAETYKNVAESENKLFGNARGIPLSIVSTSPEVQDRDFEVVRDQIRSDWQDGTNIAVTRGGQISVASVGFSQKDLESIMSKINSRDEIDSVFFGFPIRTEKLVSGEGLKEVDRFVKEKTIWPLLDLIKHDFTQQLARRYFEKNVEIVFADIRTADRALTIQEKIINSRTRTINEMREDDGQSPFIDDLFPGYGDLPVSMATNPSFVQLYYNIGADSLVDEGRIAKEPEVGNVNTLQDPSLTVAEAAKIVAMRQELVQMKKVIKKDPNRKFVTEFINDDIYSELLSSDNPIQTIEVLIKWIDDVRH